ncbi:MAG TPA: DUF3187 family protein [Woeseiaceae bacterium]|nr:DUF3187 family protein [Woeseiaceae bacterium]
MLPPDKPARRTKSRAGSHLLLAALFVGLPVTATELDFSEGLPLRNQNPFLQVFGLPPIQTALLTADGQTRYQLSFDLVNHADAANNGSAELRLDGESYFLGFSLRHGLSQRLELGIDLPVVAHADGILDNFIESWHDVFGMSNSKRRGPANELGFLYAEDGNVLYQQYEPTTGLGDLQLSAALLLNEPGTNRWPAISLRTSIKLPTGDDKDLHGSGATDLALGLYATDSYTLWHRPIYVSGFVGVLALGDGKVLPDIQKSAVAYGGLLSNWQISTNLAAIVQLAIQSSYYDTALKEIGSESVQFAVGGEYRLPGNRLLLSFGIVEDLFSNTTPDFAVHLSIRNSGS